MTEDITKRITQKSVQCFECKLRVNAVQIYKEQKLKYLECKMHF